MQHKSDLRTPAAAYATARSLAVSATVARSGSTSRYTRSPNGIGRVVPSMDGSRRECFKASTRPDSRIPSRIAERITRYATQAAKALDSAPMTRDSKKKFPSICAGFIGLSFGGLGS